MPEPTVENLLHNVDDLPTLPEVVAKILHTVEDEQSSAQDLSEILEMDAAISARVLKMANSAFYGFRGKVGSIRRALVVIGFEAVRLLALSTSVFDALNKKTQLALDARDFWMHSLGAAKAAQLLARGRTDVVSSDGCFTAGLLHDIGRYALGLVLAERYGAVLDEARETARPLCQVERERLGIDHAEAAGWLGRHWDFPEPLTAVLNHQYSPAHCLEAQEADTAIVALASAMARQAGFGEAGEAADHPLHGAIVRRLDLDDARLDELFAELEDCRQATLEFLELLSTD